MTEEELLAVDVMSMTDTQTKGLILEVDLEYPEELHDSHNSFPLAPEKLKINRDTLSDYAAGIIYMIISYTRVYIIIQ